MENLKPWQRDLLSEILKDFINTEVKRRAVALKQAEASKREPRESEARYRTRIESLHELYNLVKGENQ